MKNGFVRPRKARPLGHLSEAIQEFVRKEHEDLPLSLRNPELPEYDAMRDLISDVEGHDLMVRIDAADAIRNVPGSNLGPEMAIMSNILGVFIGHYMKILWPCVTRGHERFITDPLQFTCQATILA